MCVKLKHKFAISSQHKVAADMSNMFNKWTYRNAIKQSK